MPNFKSRLEEQHDKELAALRRRRKIKRYAYEPEKLPYVIHHSYIPDFQVQTNSGDNFFIESKGYFRPGDRQKLLAVRRSNPDVDIRIVFSQDNFLRKGSKTRYSDWAQKHGFLFAVGGIPKEWFK